MFRKMLVRPILDRISGRNWAQPIAGTEIESALCDRVRSSALVVGLEDEFGGSI